MEEKTRIISTTEELKVFSDPFRLNIINVYREHEEPLTVKGCADVLGEFPAKVHYHVKKLLEIDVLVLDHIEVINGINAKYYKLVDSRFKIQLKEDTPDVIENNLKHVNNIMISQLEQFKMDFINMSQIALKKEAANQYDVGWFSLNKLYLSENEFEELEKLLLDFVTTHNKKDDSKREYSFLTGVSHKFKD